MTCAVRNCDQQGTEKRQIVQGERDGVQVAVWLAYCPEHYVRVLAFKAAGGRWAA